MVDTTSDLSRVAASRIYFYLVFFFFSSRRRHTRSKRDWSSDVCSSDLIPVGRTMSFLSASLPGKSAHVLPLARLGRIDAERKLMVLPTGIKRLALAAAEIGRASCRERV